MRRERGLVLIISYKFAKGGLWLVLAAGLAIASRMGLGPRLHELADHLRHHAQAWSVQLGRALVRASSPRGLWVIVVALLADGVTSLVEGWALLRGRWWGPWLVVVTTSSLLPFEVVALARHAHPVRAAVLIVNVVIVVSLARKAGREAVSLRGSPAREADPRPPERSARA